MAKIEVVMESELIEALKIALVKSEAVKRTELSAEMIGKMIAALVGAKVVGEKPAEEIKPFGRKSSRGETIE